jgi:hypothetical protein
MSRVNERNYTPFGFQCESPVTHGRTGGREDLILFGLPNVLLVVSTSLLNGHHVLMQTDRTSFFGLVNIRYKDIYVTEDELDVLEGYVPIPDFCPFGFKLDHVDSSQYLEIGYEFPKRVRFLPGRVDPLPAGVSLSDDQECRWYRNYPMPGTVLVQEPDWCRLTTTEWQRRELPAVDPSLLLSPR